MQRENIFQQVRSPHLSALMPGALPPHREWVTTFMNLVVMAYNTDKVRKEELPRTYQDLLDPKWKGRLGVEANDEEWFYAIVQDMGEEKGLQFFRNLVATNAPSVRTGHSLLNNLVVSGEVPLALTVYGHMPILAKRKGAPIEWFTLEPTVAFSFGMGLAKKAAHPHAAILFYDYMLTDGQKILSQMHYFPTNRGVSSSFANVRFRTVDKAVFLNEHEKWLRLYENMVLKGK